jgi:hypothetical protein
MFLMWLIVMTVTRRCTQTPAKRALVELFVMPPTGSVFGFCGHDRSAEPGGPANRSQPIHSETNSTSFAVARRILRPGGPLLSLQSF